LRALSVSFDLDQDRLIFQKLQLHVQTKVSVFYGKGMKELSGQGVDNCKSLTSMRQRELYCPFLSSHIRNEI
jgi:hypothetical protein